MSCWTTGLYGPSIRQPTAKWHKRSGREFPSRDHLDGLTIFKARVDNPSEQTLIAQLDTIDMHHGIHSADAPYTVICVIGAALTATVRAAVSTYGFDSFILTNDEFRAARPLPQPADGR